jgi:beta-mannosidase
VWIEEQSIDIFKAGESFSIPPTQSADWIVNVTLGLRSAAKFDDANLTLSISALNLTSEPFALPTIKGNLGKTTWVNVSWSIPDGVPQRWYPHNLGNPQLYDLTGTISLPDWVEDVSFTARTGFRTIRLIQSPYTDEEIAKRGITPGDKYHFEVNGHEFYTKGANLIPFDPFYPRIQTDYVRWILESAVNSGLNMVRVWGGGHYQPSEASVAGGVYDFYRICDEIGLLAWSELEFSDAMYPINDWMLDNYEPEVRQHVRRVNRHPSNAQWAGGNEIEGIVRFNGEPYLSEVRAILDSYSPDQRWLKCVDW